MNNYLSYYIDNFETRLRSARAACDWEAVDRIFNDLQKLYSIERSGQMFSVTI